MKTKFRRYLAITIFIMVSAGLSIAAKDNNKDNQTAEKGQVHVSVSPEEAYIWVDGKPVAHRNSTLNLAPGGYTITVYNYGYAPQTQKVTVAAGERKEIDARLSPAGGRVSGPWGRIQIEGAPGGAAVFLNGTAPGFFVGHADEMNNNIMTTEQLIVPPGAHQLYIFRPGTDQPLWSGHVDVRQNQRLVVHLKEDGKAEMEYKDWAEGNSIKSLKRFEAGTASATIAVAPVTAKLAAQTPSIHCDQTGKLTWSSANAAETTVTAQEQKLADTASGSLDVQPKHTTKYELRAAGPGGVVTQDASINVDSTIQTSLTASKPNVRYIKVGDTVKEQGSSKLDWTAAHADSVKIEPIGPVKGTRGSETVRPTPAKDAVGPIDQMLTYRITATNQCGGSDTSTASIHLTGSIQGAQVARAEPPKPKLPQSASPLPLLALLGCASLAGGMMMRMMRSGR
jgi:hypothetical protein